MMETETPTLKESTDFATIYASLFSLSVSIECMQALSGLLSERGHNYARNKVKAAEDACTSAYKEIERAMSKGLGPEQREILLAAVEAQKNIMYNFFLLDTPQQNRVNGLINKIKRESQV